MSLDNSSFFLILLKEGESHIIDSASGTKKPSLSTWQKERNFIIVLRQRYTTQNLSPYVTKGFAFYPFSMSFHPLNKSLLGPSFFAQSIWGVLEEKKKRNSPKEDTTKSKETASNCFPGLMKKEAKTSSINRWGNKKGNTLKWVCNNEHNPFLYVYPKCNCVSGSGCNL